MNKAISRLAWLALAVAACGKGGDGGGGGDKAPLDPAKANAAIPAAWKGKLEFVAGVAGEKRDKVPAIMPKGWKEGFMPGSVAPADGPDWSHGTDYSVGSTCQGVCGTVKDWAAVADDSYFKQFTSGQSSAKVVKDEKSPTGRTMIAATSDTTYVYVAWWEKEGKLLYSCQVTLKDKAQELAGAFEAACNTTAGK